MGEERKSRQKSEREREGKVKIRGRRGEDRKGNPASVGAPAKTTEGRDPRREKGGARPLPDYQPVQRAPPPYTAKGPLRHPLP